MLKLGILISGSGSNLQAIIDGIERKEISDTKIVGVVSNNKQAYGLERAKKHNIETKVINPKDFKDRDDFNISLRDYFKSKDVDLIVLAGYLIVLGESFIKAFNNKIINIHPSLIPSFCGPGYYGLKVHQAVLDRGVKITGATVHIVDCGTDTGPIICQKPIRVLQKDTAEDLQKRVLEEAEWKILPYVINLFSQGNIEIINNKVKISEEE